MMIVPLDGDTPGWDGFVAGAAGSTFCHLAGWRDILSDVLRAECLYRVAIDAGGARRGVLPLVRVKSRVFGHFLVSVPFLNDGGPLGSGDARTALFGEFSSKLRNQIRRPIKEGLTARFGLDQQEAFYGVFARTMRDLGTPVLPRALFERIAATFPELVVFGAVYRGEEPLAAGCGFVWRDEFEMTWAGSLRESRRLSANMLLYWSFMEQMIARGVRLFNFGRCTPGGGTHHFKRQWGGADVPLPWCQCSSGGVKAPPSPGDSAFSWGPRLWRRLPLAVANR